MGEGEQGWNPWAALRLRDDVALVLTRLPDGRQAFLASWEDGRTLIALDDRLGVVDRNAALAHELVHLERGWHPSMGPREEAAVDREVARRLVPPAALERVAARAVDGVVVEAWEVAVEFDVPDPVAARAMTLWREVG